MYEQLLYAIEVSLNGLMTGVLYALVALGFVLIFKASGVFNYAQGVMALFAALTLVGFRTARFRSRISSMRCSARMCTISAGICRRFSQCCWRSR